MHVFVESNRGLSWVVIAIYILVVKPVEESSFGKLEVEGVAWPAGWNWETETSRTGGH